MSGLDPGPVPEHKPPPEPERPDAFSLWMNFIPVCWLMGGVAAIWTGADTMAAGVGIVLGWLYLLPPLLGRAILMLFGRHEGTFTQNQRGYRVWWVLMQLQIPFNRLPFLEELLRLVPGLYPVWIAIWGGRLSPFSLVSPGVVFIDRWLVDVGPKVVLGYRATLVGHMAIRNDAGRWVTVVAAPHVEEGALMGGEVVLGPGARLRRGAMLPAGRRIAPFGTWPPMP